MKNKIVFIVVSLLVNSVAFAQQIGYTSVTFTDSSRSNRQIATEIYYPAITAGSNAQIATGVFPVITFGHGFVMTWGAYQNFIDALVPEGYILAFPKTESGFAPNHSEFGEDLKFVLTQIKNSGAGTSVPQTTVGITSAIMGHSMGGGCGFLAAENNSIVTTLVSFATANTNPSSINAAQQVFVPTLVFSGSNDCITPPNQHQDLMYDSTTAPYKTQITITGGGHCYFANYNFNCAFGEATCTPNPSITRTEQHVATNDFLQMWLSYFLKEECNKAQEFQDSLVMSSRVTYRQNQSIVCTTTSTFESIAEIKEVAVFPNPATDFFYVELKNQKLKSIFVYDTKMKQVMEKHLLTSTSKDVLNVSTLKSGIYFVKVNDSFWTKIVIN